MKDALWTRGGAAGKLVRLIATAILLSTPYAATAQPDAAGPDVSARYRRADAILEAARKPIIANANVVPHWVGEDGAFWYVDQSRGRDRYMIVDDAKNVSLALDPARVDAMLRGSDVTAPASLVDLQSGVRATFRVGAVELTCDLMTDRCAPPSATDPLSLPSPDGRFAAFVRDDNVWVRDLRSGVVTALTTDGAPNWSWGKVPDIAMRALDVQAGRLTLRPWGFRWSPDSRYLIGGRSDERAVAPYPLLESVPRDGSLRPRVHQVRQALVGEEGPTFSLAVFDVARGKQIQVDLPPRNLGYFMLLPIGWDRARAHFYLLEQTNEGGAWVTEVEAASGRARRVVEEKINGYPDLTASFYSRPNVRPINDGRQLLWYSERSGWGQLYRYDMRTGKLLNAVTRGKWAFRDIIGIDERRQRVLFTAGGREPGDPYRRYVYRVNFDGSDLRLLTREPADHMLDGPANDLVGKLNPAPPVHYVSPDGRTFVDRYATLSEAPSTVLRETNSGRIVARLAQADSAIVDRLGLRAPEPFVAKAADGVTDLHGVIFWPKVRGPHIPVIDALYGGPQLAVTPHNYVAAFGPASLDRHLLAELGFAVVVVDGRGTPQRSRDFHSVSYGNFADLGLNDHVAVLHELGRRYPALALDGVGVLGHSFGGYVAARALLRYPDFYKVGVSGAGSHVFEAMPDTVGIWLPPPDYGASGARRPGPGAAPQNYVAIDNTTLASRLKGKLLLAYGDLDENAWPALTMRLADAFNKADRPYDLLYTAGATHGTVWTPAATHRMWDYFVEHLMRVTPPPRIGTE